MLLSLEAVDELFAGLTDAQRAQLRELLLMLRDQLAAEHDPACRAADAEEAG